MGIQRPGWLVGRSWPRPQVVARPRVSGTRRLGGDSQWCLRSTRSVGLEVGTVQGAAVLGAAVGHVWLFKQKLK